MTDKQIQKILDSFHVGKVLHSVELENDRILIETTQGIFGIVGIKPAYSFGYDDPKLEKKVNKLFGSQSGKVIKTSELTPVEPQQIIPLTHRQDKYWYCLKF